MDLSRPLPVAALVAAVASSGPSGCARAATEDRPEGPPYAVDVWGCPHQERVPYLRLFTTHDYSCSNYSLDTEIREYGTTIEISITGVSGPEICATAFGPAGASMPLPDRGTYEVIINADDQASSPDRYEVTVEEHEVILRAEQASITRPGSRRTERCDP